MEGANNKQLRERIVELEVKLDAINHFLKKVRDRDYIRVERSWVITSLEKILNEVPTSRAWDKM